MPARKKAVKKEENKLSPNSFKIGIKNFGPISEGEIEVKPLTILIGPNNSGKSYAAMFLNALFESVLPSISGAGLLKASPYSDIFVETEIEMRDDFYKYRKTLLELNEGEVFLFPEKFTQKIDDFILNGIFNHRLMHQIEYLFNSKLTKLTSIGKKTSEFVIKNKNFNIRCTYSNNYWKVRKHIAPEYKIELVKSKEDHHEVGLPSPSKNLRIGIGRRFYTASDTALKEEMRIFMITYLNMYFFELLSFSMYKQSYYLPAARSSLLSISRTITASLLRERMPGFTGSIINFLSSILIMSEDEALYFKIAKELEKELIQGELISEPKLKNQAGDIYYLFKGRRIPLINISSSINELAPLILYLKHLIESSAVVIFEEPEAHLHPANQRLLAKYLVRLIRNGLKLVITTHSEYLLEQISHFIQMKEIAPAKRTRKYKVGKDDYLNSDEVSVHAFNYDRKSKGFKINKIAINDEDGISQEEFNKVIDALYDESVKIRRDLGIEK